MEVLHKERVIASEVMSTEKKIKGISIIRRDNRRENVMEHGRREPMLDRAGKVGVNPLLRACDLNRTLRVLQAWVDRPKRRRDGPWSHSSCSSARSFCETRCSSW